MSLGPVQGRSWAPWRQMVVMVHRTWQLVSTVRRPRFHLLPPDEVRRRGLSAGVGLMIRRSIPLDRLSPHVEGFFSPVDRPLDLDLLLDPLTLLPVSVHFLVDLHL